MKSGWQIILPFIIAACLSTRVRAQDQNAQKPQSTSSTSQGSKQANSPLPQPPLTPQIPSPEELKESQGPVLSAAPSEAYSPPAPEPGLPGIPASTTSFSISGHDKDEGGDIARDLIQDATRQSLGLGDPPSIQSTFADAIASGTEKVLGVTSHEFLQNIVSKFLGDASLLLDSETAAAPSPNPVRTASSGMLNLGRVASGGNSPFADANLAQACSRLQTIYAQTRFDLNATQQNQVQSASDWCSQKSSAPSTQPIGPVTNTNSLAAPTPAGTVSPAKQQPAQVQPCVMYHYACNK